VSVLRRDVVRGLVFDDDGRILLLRWRDPVTGKEFFEPPGGQREPGESHEGALIREIAEESGLVDVEVHGEIGVIDHAFTFAGKDYDCVERYFSCRVTGPGRTELSLDAVEATGVVGAEWFTPGELATLEVDVLEPPQLRALVEDARAMTGEP
jgi:8-oxo-dGTP pyrophosphatase MutT (NUDIX family)